MPWSWVWICSCSTTDGLLTNILAAVIAKDWGDWEVTADKLPNGITHLTQVAKGKRVKFGLWIEPEMVNPKSELYEKHKDWVIHLPNRDGVLLPQSDGTRFE